MAKDEYPLGTTLMEVSDRTGAMRQKIYMGDGRWEPFCSGREDDPYWDLPERPLKVEEHIYELISREMIHDGWGKGDPLESFLEPIRAEAAKAPEGCPVFVKYDTEGDYEGGSYYFLQIGYERPPTKAEMAKRRKINDLIAERDAKRAEEAAEREREQFERLKAKYEA